MCYPIERVAAHDLLAQLQRIVVHDRHVVRIRCARDATTWSITSGVKSSRPTRVCRPPAPCRAAVARVERDDLAAAGAVADIANRRCPPRSSPNRRRRPLELDAAPSCGSDFCSRYPGRGSRAAARGNIRFTVRSLDPFVNATGPGHRASPCASPIASAMARQRLV